jgi:hypothetical protein
MPDLGLLPWCSNPLDRRVDTKTAESFPFLQTAAISRQLPLEIDPIFGFLEGDE